MSPFFQSPAATMGVPMYMSSDLARQHVSCCKTSTSALLSLFLSRFTFFYICSLATLPYSFLSITTLTPRYFTILVHLTSLTASSFSLVSISDFFLFSRRFHCVFNYARASMVSVRSWTLFDITNMSSANASKSPLFLTASSLTEDLSASSKYTLKSTGDRIEPCGSPISALSLCPPISISDCLWSFVIKFTIYL